MLESYSFVQKNEKGSERPLSWLIYVQCQVKRKANCLINNLTLRERRYFAIFYSLFLIHKQPFRKVYVSFLPNLMM